MMNASDGDISWSYLSRYVRYYLAHRMYLLVSVYVSLYDTIEFHSIRVDQFILINQIQVSSRHFTYLSSLNIIN